MRQPPSFQPVQPRPRTTRPGRAFVAFVPSLAIFAFGLSLVARDGLLVLIALTLSAGVLGLIGWRLVGA